MTQFTDHQAILADLAEPHLTDAQRIEALEKRLKDLEDTVYARRARPGYGGLGALQRPCGRLDCQGQGNSLTGILCRNFGCPHTPLPQHGWAPNWAGRQ